MKLGELLSVLNEYKSSEKGSTEVLGITADTRNLKPGYLFIALKGLRQDGHDKIAEAFINGAIGVIIDNKKYKGKNCFFVKNARVALNLLAQKFYQFPSQNLHCMGVTGTNGKTSCTYLYEHMLNSANVPTGVIGTINHHLRDHVWTSDHTTPDSVTIQQRLHEMVDQGARAVAMEVSSHALVQQRVAGVQFNTVLFTNLTLDHLDYHKTMQNYFFAKQLLFSDYLWTSSKKITSAVINIDDSWGQQLRIAGRSLLATYGQRESDFQFKVIAENFSHTEFQLKTWGQINTVSVPLIGLYNVYNVVGSMAAAQLSGVSLSQSILSLPQFAGVPGRMQKVANSKGLHIFIDYAHTPDGLLNVLRTLQRVKNRGKEIGKICTVFGCGGDRDKSKRPVMGQIATELSDSVIITSDNPRSENPAAIISEIKAGATGKSTVHTQVDRKQAFVMALDQAKSGDVILVAGKGHENTQTIGSEVLPFNDYQMMKELVG